LERGLGVLATISNIAPLLGFLGTVSGMINSFEALARAGLSNPGLVAQGISEALITTAAGLAVAIPILAAYNYFTARIGTYVLEMETAANVLLETYAEMEGPSDKAA
jgi:biopolymer transport protein ExbB